jgi:diaminopimelate epimerase
MTYSKWHALGNTYVVTPPLPDPTPGAVRDLVDCADGLVEVAPRGPDEADVVIWNADGSRAEMSGNATRIAAAWLAEQTGAPVVRIHVGQREVVVRQQADGSAEQELGPVAVGAPEEVDGIAFTPVDVGNPHAVVRGDPSEIARIGPKLEAHPRFPSRTNVQVARVDGPGRVTARVWERGVGETASSGTSAVAVAAACVGEGTTVVSFPGGALTVRIEGGRAFLTGRAERLA